MSKPLVDGADARDVEALHEALLRRTLAVARAADVDVRLCTTGAPVGLEEIEVVPQVGGSFAERLEHAVAGAFAAGWREVVLIGGDTPGLDGEHLRRAFAALDGAPGPRAVVGPACDGGYYLLALNAFTTRAFRDVPLGTPTAGGATIDALAAAGFGVATLPPLRDVDDEADVAALALDRGVLGRAARLVLAPSLRNPSPARSAPTNRHADAIRSRGPPVLPSTIS